MNLIKKSVLNFDDLPIDITLLILTNVNISLHLISKHYLKIYNNSKNNLKKQSYIFDSLNILKWGYNFNNYKFAHCTFSKAVYSGDLNILMW